MPRSTRFLVLAPLLLLGAPGEAQEGDRSPAEIASMEGAAEAKGVQAGVFPAAPVAPPIPSACDSLPAVLLEPMPLYEMVLGSYTRPISARSPEAQAFFDQGLQLFYSFAPVDAARSFHEAQKRAPECAICYWGSAGLGSLPERSPPGRERPPGVRGHAASHGAPGLGHPGGAGPDRGYVPALHPRP